MTGGKSNQQEDNSTFAERFVSILLQDGHVYTTDQLEKSLNSHIKNGKISEDEKDAIIQIMKEEGKYTR